LDNSWILDSSDQRHWKHRLT